MKKNLIHEHFKKHDPIMYKHMEVLDFTEGAKPTDLFKAITEDIVGQQLSGKAAHAIYARFESLFPDHKVTPEALIKITPDTLRSAGMAWAKVRSLHDFAQKVIDKTIRLETLDTLSDEEVIEHLIQVKGIGRWTAEMFLMFTLGRPDVFSFGDLGLKKGIQKIYNLPSVPTIEEMEKIVSKWSPHKTYAARIVWLVLDNR